MSAEIEEGRFVVGVDESKRMCGIEDGVRRQRKRAKLGTAPPKSGAGVGQRASVGNDLVRVRPCAVADVKRRARRHKYLRQLHAKQPVLCPCGTLDSTAEDVRAARILLAGLRRNERTVTFLHQLEVSIEQDSGVRVRDACGDVQVEFAQILVEVFQLHHLEVAAFTARNAFEAVVAVGCRVVEAVGSRRLLSWPGHVAARIEQNPVLLVVRAVEFPVLRTSALYAVYRPTVHPVHVHDLRREHVVVHDKREIGRREDDALGVVRFGSRIVVVEEVRRRGCTRVIAVERVVARHAAAVGHREIERMVGRDLVADNRSRAGDVRDMELVSVQVQRAATRDLNRAEAAQVAVRRERAVLHDASVRREVVAGRRLHRNVASEEHRRGR